MNNTRVEIICFKNKIACRYIQTYLYTYMFFAYAYACVFYKCFKINYIKIILTGPPGEKGERGKRGPKGNIIQYNIL